MNTGRPAIFVDRDGTIIVEGRYLSDPEAVRVIDGAGPALRRLQDAGFALVVITNQSGIARGLYGEQDFFAVQQRVGELLARHGVTLDGAYHCPHHPDWTGPCDCRKPGTLLFERASADLGLDLRRSWYVGDRLRDVEPAARLGGHGILVRTGYGREQEGHAGDYAVVDDIGGAAERILLATQG